MIIGYCKGHTGYDFIERGDYEMICADDNQASAGEKFSSTVGSGMKFIMSISCIDRSQRSVPGVVVVPREPQQIVIGLSGKCL